MQSVGKLRLFSKTIGILRLQNHNDTGITISLFCFILTPTYGQIISFNTVCP